MITALNSELAKLTDWLKANKLLINVSKTHYMVFHRSRRKLDKEDILLDNTIIKQVTFTIFLGIIINDKLQWIHHISYINNKISKGMGIILKARKVLKRKGKDYLQLYHSFVILYLIYCVEIWGNASDIHLHQLITTQKKIVQIITFSSYSSHTKIIFNQLNILPFKHLRFQRIGLQMFKYELPVALNMFFVKNRSVHNYNTRNKDKLSPTVAKHAYSDRDSIFFHI